MCDLRTLQKEIHEIAVEHGWWEDERPVAEIIALCHSELSEALESARKGESAEWFNDNGKPEGVATEFIDCLIRILDYAEHEGWDTEKIVKDKMEYNRTREYRHGGKKF